MATLFILVWWLVPPLLYRHTGTANDAKLKAITDTRTALMAGLVGLGALLTFRLNSRVYRITAETFDLSRQEHELTRQGQITERYTKAIEQLGNKALDVRLGGIYALERLALDSPEREHPTVVEVLSAYVREHSNPAHAASEPWVATVLSSILQGNSGAADERQPDADQPDRRPMPATDVQAALTVLGRLPPRPKVRRGDLNGAQLAGAQLTRANLSRARLTGANLFRARIGYANLSGARLDGANLSRAQLGGANLSSRAQLKEADLSGASLLEANLADAQLFKANLSGAELIRANLAGAWLGRADLSGAQLKEADLSDATLSGADLSGTRLEGADLSGANLAKGADGYLTVGLTQAQVDAAKGDARTQLPDGLRRPASWATADRSAVTRP